MKYAERPLIEYIRDAASSKPAPGGGSVSALVGALASAMAQMAANFTIGREKFKEVEAEATELLKRCEKSCQKFLDLMERDISSYEELAAAYKLPKTTSEESEERRLRIQDALKSAMEAPLEICRETHYLLSATRSLVEIANPRLLSDVAVAAVLCRGAFHGAKLNVLVNLASIDERDLVIMTTNELEDLEREVEASSAAVLDRVTEEISGSQ